MGEEFKEDIFKRGEYLKIDLIQVKGLKGKLNFLYMIQFLLKLIKILKRKHYDIIHAHITKTGISGRTLLV